MQKTLKRPVSLLIEKRKRTVKKMGGFIKIVIEILLPLW